MAIELRDYQVECVNRVVSEYKANPKSKHLLVLPCAAGKTVIFSHIIHSLAREYGLNAIVLCHLDELMDQAAEKYRMVKPDAIIGKVGSGQRQYGGEVTVAGVQTLSRPEHLRNLRALYGTGNKLILVIDEAHLSAAPSYQRIQETLPDAFVLLVTATPYRLDGKPIIDKPPLFSKTILEMIQEGYLCDIRAIAIKTEVSLDEIKSLAGDFNERDLNLAINTPIRNKRIVDAYQEHASGKRALAFCVTVDHATALASTFNEAGIPAAVVSGKTPLPERKRLYGLFERGELLVLTTVNVLSIGFDSPRAEVAIMSRPTQSQALYVQQAGRVLRLAPGKKCALLLDITDNSQRMRIMPKTFKSLAPKAKDAESLLDSVEREENEKAENEAQEKRALIRKLNERRNEDKQVDLFGLPEWQERDGGMFVLEVGLQKHRIALVPKGDSSWTQLYEVWARLAPSFEAQKWLSAQPLDYCQQFAEKKARMLAESSKNAVLVDKSAAWREQPISEGQEKFLKWKKIEVFEGMTKGQAADLIEDWKEQDAEKKRKKAERAAARAQRNEVSA